jgi:streptomycin 6-kinase
MKALKQNILILYREEGRKWLNNLPKLIMQMETTYGLSNLKPVKNLSYNYVLSGLCGSESVVLKLGLDVNGFKREAAALQAFQGFGAVQVLAENTGMLLLECAVPGVSLKSYFPESDDEAINITADVIQRLHKAPIPLDHTFPYINDWLAALDRDWNIPAEHLQKARQLRDNLLQTSDNPVLLHGDLHHDNILQNGDNWVVIDPKGVIGEPAYEVAAFIRNPMPELLTRNNGKNIISNRISRFAERLALSPQRIHDWCYVQAVLCWAWALEDQGDTAYYKKFTNMLFKSKR